MDYRGIQKLKAFFSALKDSGFKQDLKQIPSFAMIDGQRTPVDKAYCLSLLRQFPQFQGDKFKDDNAIIKYLSDPINRKFLLGNFTTEQQIELTKVLEEKPVAVEAVSEQPSGQEQPLPAGETPSSMTGGGMPQIPTIQNVPRVYRPQKPPEVKTYPKPPVIETGLDYEGKPYEVKETSGAKTRGRRFQIPKISGVTNFAKNFGSRAGVFFQRNIGKYLTVGRIGTAVSAVIGGVAGSTFGGAGMFAGAIGGGILPSFIKSGGATRFLGKVGNGAINTGVRLSNQVSRGGLNLAGPKKKIWLLFLGMFGAFFFLTAFTGVGTPGGSIPAPGGGSTAPICTTDSSGINLFAKDAVPDDKLQAFIEKNKSLSELSPETFAQRARYIRDTAQAAGLNPAFFLALWRTESNFSKYSAGARPGNDLGCIRTPPDRPPSSDQEATFQWGVRCVTGMNSGIDNTCKSEGNNTPAAICAKNYAANPATAADTEACRCVRDVHAKHKGKACYQDFNIPIQTIHDYLQAYGSKCFDPNNENTIKNAPKFASEILGIAAGNPSSICTNVGTGLNTCPLTGTVQTSTGTKAYPEGNPPSGHCGLRYGAYPWCSEASLNATQTSKASFAIDVSAGGKTDVPIVLPKINNESLVWKLHVVLPITSIGGGLDFIGRSASGTEYFLHLYHLNGTGSTITGFVNKTEFTSGETVSTQLYPLAAEDGGPHLHFTIARRNSSTNNQWVMLEPNAQLHMCDGKSAPPSGDTTPTGKSVVLDPGHGNPDPVDGKTSEGALNLVIANRLKSVLETSGLTVTLTHNSNIPTTDKYQAFLERVKRINATNANILVSIHFDSSSYPFTGPRAYYNNSRSFSDQNKKMAESIGTSLVQATGLNTAGGSTGLDSVIAGCPGPLYILGPQGQLTCPDRPESEIKEESKMPGVLVEMFIQKPYTEIAADEELVNRIVSGYAQGITRYFQQ